MKAREFVRKYVEPAGGVLESKRGDHHVYRFPNGRTFDVPMGGKQSEASHFLLPKLRRLLRAGGAAAAVVVVVLFTLAWSGCGGAQFTTADGPVPDGGTSEPDAGSGPDIVSDIGPHVQVGDAGAEAGEDREAAVDAADGGVAVPEAGDHSDARADAGMPVEASADAAPDAPPACVTDLSDIGTGDFHVSFTITTSATGLTVALLSQRTGCVTSTPFWDITMSTTGGITLSTGDGSGMTYFVEAGNAVNDGQPHHVVVQRVAGLISYWRDGVLGSSMSPDPDAFGALPVLVNGTSACAGTTAALGHASLSNVCITRD